MSNPDTEQYRNGLSESADVIVSEAADMADEAIVFIDTYATEAEIGLFSHEKGRKQPLTFSLEAGCHYGSMSNCQDHASVVCYKDMIAQIEDILNEGHIELVETVADRVASKLMQDQRILWLRISVRKPDAIQKAEGVGVTLTRRRKRLLGS